MSLLVRKRYHGICSSKNLRPASPSVVAAEANAEGTTNGGKKNAKKNETQAKGGEDVATASQALLGKIKAKKGKEKKKKTAEDSKAADGEDVEGGGRVSLEAHR